MAIKVAAWNVKAGLGDQSRTPKIVEGLKVLDADYLVLSEAARADGYFDGVLWQLASEGYDCHITPYNDEVEHPSGQQHLLTLNRLGTTPHNVRLDGRNGSEVFVIDPQSGEEIQLLGAHFDDRYENLRLGMAGVALSLLDLTKPSVLAGDLNAMHDGFRAGFIRNSLGQAARLPQEIHPKIDRFRSLATRLGAMADGRTMQGLKRRGLLDADPKHQATMKLGPFAVAQLDHIMHSRRLQSSDFRVRSLKGSDHKAISAELRVL